MNEYIENHSDIRENRVYIKENIEEIASLKDKFDSMSHLSASGMVIIHKQLSILNNSIQSLQRTDQFNLNRIIALEKRVNELEGLVERLVIHTNYLGHSLPR